MKFILAFDNAFWKENPQMIFPVIKNNSITFERAQNNLSFESVNGELATIGKLNLATFTVESIFPNKPYSWITPGASADGWYYVRMIEDVRKRQIPFRAVHLDRDGKEIFNIAAIVDSFAYSVDVAGDINYSIGFKEYRFALSEKTEKLNVNQNLTKAEKTANIAVTESSATTSAADPSGNPPTTAPKPTTPRYTEADALKVAKVFYGAARGFHVGTKLACVAWTICNRIDDGRFPNTFEKVCVWGQVEYKSTFPTKNDFGEDLLAFAKDVLDRWSCEKEGKSDVGRVLPKDYFYYGGTGDLSFRKAYDTKSQHWDYSLKSPYSVMR